MYLKVLKNIYDNLNLIRKKGFSQYVTCLLNIANYYTIKLN